MRIERLRAANVRKIRNAELEPGPELNIIYGDNGSGKTSLLETIHLLGYGRSFRTRRLAELVSHGQSQLTAFCEVVDAAGRHTSIGIERGGPRPRIRVDGQDVRTTSALVRRLPTVFIGPDCARLLEESELRRRVLDWALFHVEPRYLEVYQRFARALRQRNAALRTGEGDNALEAWDRELANPGQELHALRAEHAAPITRFASQFLADILPVAVEVHFSPGWDVEVDLLELWERQRATDRRLGYTGRGPQRADLVLAAGTAPARTVLSRGESKLMAMGLMLAQAAYFAVHRLESPIVLVDDLGTELDERSRERFVSALESLGGQCFITTVVGGSDLLFRSEVREGDRVRQFHVEQGAIRQVI